MRPTWIVLLLAACSGDYTINPGGKTDAGEDTDIGVGVPAPRIRITPESLDFGPFPPQCAAPDKVIVVENVGERPLDVTELEIKGAGAAGYSHDATLPFRLRVGETREVRIGFAPLNFVAHPARIQVTSNDPVDAVVRVPLSGEGADAAVREEVFIQQEADAVDVLWVIDTSCSMDPYQQRVAGAMGTFIQSFVNLGLDFHMAVTTTDMDYQNAPGSKGRFVGPIITPSTPDPVSEFTRQTVLGSSGSSHEAGFRAAYTALTPPLVNGQNAGFLRHDATLAIVVVADEDDRDAHDEIYGTQRPRVTDDFVTWLHSMKPNRSHVTFSAMTQPQRQAPQYHRAIGATNGVFANINQTDVTPFLTHLSYAAAGLLYRFPLAETPISPTAVTVEVGGQSVPQGVIDGWTYDPATNEIVLHGAAIPEPGEIVNVRYPYDPGC